MVKTAKTDYLHLHFVYNWL